MSLHDRIMNEADNHSLDTDHGCGYVDGMTRAAILAKEADELMSEMAKELEWHVDPEVSKRILAKYESWKEQTNERN